MFAESLNAVVGQACSSLVFVHCFSLFEGEGSFLSFFFFFFLGYWFQQAFIYFCEFFQEKFGPLSPTKPNCDMSRSPVTQPEESLKLVEFRRILLLLLLLLHLTAVKCSYTKVEVSWAL